MLAGLGPADVASAFIAAAVIVVVTLLVERRGGVIGGMLGTVPHVAVVGSCAFFKNLGMVDFQRAVLAMPVGMLMNSVFALTLALSTTHLTLRRCRLLVVVGLAMLTFAILVALLLLLLRLDAQPLALVRALAFCSFALELCIGVWMAQRFPSPPKTDRRSSLRAFAFRALLTFTAFLSAMAVARSVPALAGILANLPLVTTFVFIVLWMTQSEAVAVGAAGTIVIGMLSASSYALLASWLMPALHAVGGVVASWLLAVGCVTAPLLWWLRRRSTRPVDSLASTDAARRSTDDEAPLPFQPAEGSRAAGQLQGSCRTVAGEDPGGALT